MHTLYMTQQFKDDIDCLPPQQRQTLGKTLRQIAHNPRHKGLGTEKQYAFGKGRDIFRSRVDQKYRLLWEYGPVRDAISLWRVGHHEFIDSFSDLPRLCDSTSTVYALNDDVSLPENGHGSQPKPIFYRFHDNHLRLFGIPDSLLDTVRQLTDVEALWDIPLPKNVQATLIDIVTSDSAAEVLMNPQKLLYRETADRLEGYCKGEIKHLMLNLTDEQRGLVALKIKGPMLVKGVAGSGKTTIGIYRAKTLLESLNDDMFGDGRILVLTYNKTLTGVLEELLTELHVERATQVHVKTLSSLLVGALRPLYGSMEFADASERKAFVRKAKASVIAETPGLERHAVMARDESFFIDEIDQVIYARGITTLETYQKIERVGRRVGFDRDRDRPFLWHVYEVYRNLLDESRKYDWGELPLLALAKHERLPRYSAVIVDEAQDLSPASLRVVSHLVDRQNDRGLFLLADAAQSIYYRGISWKESGISVQGRTRTLNKNFRNTQEILTAARPILEKCEDLKQTGELLEPTSAQRRGPKPILARYEDITQGCAYITETIVRLCQNGEYRPGDFCVLTRNDGEAINQLRHTLSEAKLPQKHFRDGETLRLLENEVKLITMHSAKGLEFPVVFLFDLSDEVIPHIKSRDTEEDDLQQERKLFYVSMTRAADRLYLLCPKRSRSRFLRELAEETVTQKACATFF